jgi:hypothetical protein
MSSSITSPLPEIGQWLEFYRAANTEGCGSTTSFKMTQRDGKTLVHGSGSRWGIDENDKPFHTKVGAVLLDDLVRDAAATL